MNFYSSDDEEDEDETDGDDDVEDDDDVGAAPVDEKVLKLKAQLLI